MRRPTGCEKLCIASMEAEVVTDGGTEGEMKPDEILHAFSRIWWAYVSLSIGLLCPHCYKADK